MIRQVTNNGCLRDNATRISQSLSILISHDPCCYLSSKKLVWFNFLLFCTLGLVSTLLKNNPAFPPISRICSAERICRIAKIIKSWKFFIFLYRSLKVTGFIRQIINNKYLRDNPTRFSQSLSTLVSLDLCCYLSSEKLVWFSFLLFCTLWTSPAFYLVIIQSFLNFLPIPRTRSAERIHGIGGNV